MKKAVYLNDLGIINALGRGKSEVLKSVLEGKATLSRKTIGSDSYTIGLCPPLKHHETNRVLNLLYHGCEEIASSVSLLVRNYGAERIAVILGSTDNGSEQSFLAHKEYRKTGHFPEGYALLKQQAHLPSEYVKSFFDLKSMAVAVSTACTSSAGALIHGRNLLRMGVVDAVIAGGADIVSDSVLKGFISLEAVDPEASNPFSKNRKGINLGEGAALFVMSRKKIPGGENILLTGCGESADAYHATAPHPEGLGSAAAMKQALADAGLKTVDYINLHGTGTKLNDLMEARATARVFGDRLPPASGTKPLTGHTLGASGAVELGICWLLLSGENQAGRLPPHLWDRIPDPDLPELKFVNPGESLKSLGSCMSNSYAFGGSNVSLIIEKGKE